MAQKHGLHSSKGLIMDDTFYRILVGALQYLALTLPDLSFSVNLVCQFMQNPNSSHFQGIKRLLRYIKGTIDFGLRILS